MAQIELQGMDELLKKLEKLGKDADRIEETALKAAGKVLVDETRREVPVRTGRLKESIRVSDIKINKNGKFLWVGDVDRKAEYGWYVEFGTSNTPANPFMSRAFEGKKDEIKETIASEVKRGLGL